MFTIEQRDVPEQVVLTERHEHIRQADLPDLNRDTMARLAKAAEELGGVHGLIFAAFPNEVYDENDITLEVCVPIPAMPASTVDGVRVEPAHREAFVRLTKQQTFPPHIGSAYGAVAQWVAEQGATITAAPREVYFTDFYTAGPDDAVFDVAFPYA